MFGRFKRQRDEFMFARYVFELRSMRLACPPGPFRRYKRRLMKTMLLGV